MHLQDGYALAFEIASEHHAMGEFPTITALFDQAKLFSDFISETDLESEKNLWCLRQAYLFLNAKFNALFSDDDLLEIYAISEAKEIISTAREIKTHLLTTSQPTT
jgi:hypothetical protein